MMDITKGWKRKFGDVKSLGNEPPLNRDGLWKRSEKTTQAILERAIGSKNATKYRKA